MTASKKKLENLGLDFFTPKALVVAVVVNVLW